MGNGHWCGVGQTCEGLRDGSVSAGKKSETSWSRRTRFLHEGHVGRFSSHFSRQLLLKEMPADMRAHTSRQTQMQMVSKRMGLGLDV